MRDVTSSASAHSSPPTRTAAAAVVEQLAELGADLVFGVPGESYLAVLDALRDSGIRFVTCRQEGGAGYAAEAYGKLTGRPGVVMVTRGPGATNVSVAVHTAQQDETPMLVFVGDIPSAHRGRGAFQELDFSAFFGPMAKAVFRLDRADHASELVARSWALATAGRPGPVVIVLPEDVLEEPTDIAAVSSWSPPCASVGAGTARQVRELLEESERAVLIAGGSRWTASDCAALPDLQPGMPLVTSFRRQDLVDPSVPSFVGSLGLGADPALLRRVADADLVLAVGDPLGDATTDSYRLLGVPVPRMPLVHVYPDPGELGRVHRPTLAIEATPGAFLEAMGAAPAPARASWGPWLAAARAEYCAWSAGDGLLESVARGLSEVAPADAVLTCGAGNFTRPFQRAFAFGRPRRQLAPVSGSMGYGLPAAVAAKLVHPDRAVICVAGDGELMMTVQELATAAHVGAELVVLVVNNGRYGTIQTHQERRYPGREMATALTNPDFVALGEAFGFRALRTTAAADTIEALERALGSGGSHVIELRL